MTIGLEGEPRIPPVIGGSPTDQANSAILAAAAAAATKTKATLRGAPASVLVDKEARQTLSENGFESVQELLRAITEEQNNREKKHMGPKDLPRIKELKEAIWHGTIASKELEEVLAFI